MNRKKKGTTATRTDRTGSLFPIFNQHPELAEILVVIFGVILLMVFAGSLMSLIFGNSKKAGTREKTTETEEKKVKEASVKKIDPDKIKPEIEEDLLTVSEYNRPGIALEEVNGVVIHYVQNPGSTAAENRRYFENLAQTKETKASAHFIVGLDGEILQLVPLDEMAYCSNSANKDTISIECCHPDETGKFSDETYISAVQLTAWLCALYDLDSEDVIRHYDVTGKRCPLYYVKHEDAWEQFRQNVKRLYSR